MELWRRPDAFDPHRGTLPGYVSLLGRSRALDRLRAHAALESATERSRRETLMHGARPESAIEPLLRKERSREVLGALGELPDQQREALLMAYGLGLSTSELAQAARVPLGTAKSRLRLGLSKARASLENAA